MTNQKSSATLEVVAKRKGGSGWGGARPGSGRKRVVQAPVRFTVDFEVTDFERLKAVSEEKGVSVASLVREAVRGYLARRRKG